MAQSYFELVKEVGTGVETFGMVALEQMLVLAVILVQFLLTEVQASLCHCCCTEYSVLKEIRLDLCLKLYQHFSLQLEDCVVGNG